MALDENLRDEIRKQAERMIAAHQKVQAEREQFDAHRAKLANDVAAAERELAATRAVIATEQSAWKAKISAFLAEFRETAAL
jgi:hypothetical protein